MNQQAQHLNFIFIFLYIFIVYLYLHIFIYLYIYISYIFSILLYFLSGLTPGACFNKNDRLCYGQITWEDGLSDGQTVYLSCLSKQAPDWYSQSVHLMLLSWMLDNTGSIPHTWNMIFKQTPIQVQSFTVWGWVCNCISSWKRWLTFHCIPVACCQALNLSVTYCDVTFDSRVMSEIGLLQVQLRSQIWYGSDTFMFMSVLT